MLSSRLSADAVMPFGGVLPNGITASALSLLDSIDYSRFDVTVFYPHTTRPERVALIDLINPNVRLLPRTGGMLASKVQVRPLATSQRVPIRRARLQKARPTH